MNYAIILAGGSGSRMKLKSIPKQYLKVNNREIIAYAIEKFQNHSQIDKIIVVVANEWKEHVEEVVKEEKFTKVVKYALGGASRQMSIYNGLSVVRSQAEENDIVIIHDAARPCVDEQTITECIEATKSGDGAMPVITVKDTIYLSENGEKIDKLLNRDELYAGQSPECFRFGKYIKIHDRITEDEINLVRGSSEIAFKGGMDIQMIKGHESNFKITTMEDLDKFKLLIEH